MTKENKHLGSLIRKISLESEQPEDKKDKVVLVGSLGTIFTKALDIAYDKNSEVTVDQNGKPIGDVSIDTVAQTSNESQEIDGQLKTVADVEELQKQLGEKLEDDVFIFKPKLDNDVQNGVVNKAINQIACFDDCVPKEIIFYTDAATQSALVGGINQNGFSKDVSKEIAIESIQIIVNVKKK